VLPLQLTRPAAAQAMERSRSLPRGGGSNTAVVISVHDNASRSEKQRPISELEAT